MWFIYEVINMKKFGNGDYRVQIQLINIIKCDLIGFNVFIKLIYINIFSILIIKLMFLLFVV